MAKYPLFAAVSGQTVLDEAFFRARDALNDFLLIYEGTQFNGKTGSGIVEYNLAQYNYALRLKTNNVTEIGRVEFEIRKEGEGADLIVALVQGFNPDGSDDGVVIIERLMPKEFLPNSKSWVSIPLGVDNLVRDAYYWLIVKQNGDAVNNVRLIGENNQDALYPVWKRTGGSGAWTAENAIHFKVYSGTSGKRMFSVYGNGWYQVDWDDQGRRSKMYVYLPDAQGGAGLREVMSFIYSGSMLVKGVKQ